MNIQRNDYNNRFRAILDRLPHESRRAIFRLARPGIYNHLMEMRAGKVADYWDLSTYIKYRTIYVHVPKTAGISLKKSLFDGRFPSHLTMHHYKVAFTRREFESFFKFSFVRNPWDRLHSAWRFLNAGGLHGGDALMAKKYLSPYENFEDFVMHGLHRPEMANVLHLTPQVNFITLRPGIPIPLNFLGYYEQLADDFAHVADRMGRPEVTMPWENRTRHGSGENYKDVYTPRMIEKVREQYRLDVETFGYSFDDFTPIKLNRK